MEISEGDSSFFIVGASSMIMGSFDGGWGLPTSIMVLLQALKYIDVYLFLFPFWVAGVFNVARTVSASLASVSGGTSPCCSSSSSFVVFPMSVVSIFVSAVSGGVFSFYC